MTKVGDGRAAYQSSRAREKNRKRPFRPAAVFLSLNLFKQCICSTPPASSMANVGYGRAPYRSRRAREKNYIKEDPWNVSEEAEQNVVEEQTDSRAKAYKFGTIGIGQVPRQGSNLIANKASDLPKTSALHPATIDNLPDEILSNIFIRLLSKQLARMRSVSKSWNALLSEPSFVKSHLHHSIHNNDPVLLLFNPSICCSNSKPLTAHLSRSPNPQLTGFIKLPVQSPHNDSVRVIGAVHGLICYASFDDYVIQIWNPSLSAMSTLPPSPTPSRSCCRSFFRFGFDPKTDDYKVLKLTCQVIFKPPSADSLLQLPEGSVKKWLHVEVYSMRKGSWEPINARPPSCVSTIFSMDYVCVDGHNGHLHWLGCYFGGKRYPETLVTFDLGSQTFSEMPLPDYGEVFIGLGVLGGKLCLMSVNAVWVMEEYGVAESCVKRHVFSQFNPFTYQIGFTSQNEILIEDFANNRSLALYDPIANKTRSLKRYCCGELDREHRVVEYVDSLVWVVPPKH